MSEAGRDPMQALLYAVSHDLQAPVRHLQGYLQLLDPYREGLDAEGAHFLDAAAENAHRLQRMLDALLALSRLETTDWHSDDLDLALLVADVQDALREHPRAGDVAWSVGDLPALRGDGDRVKRLLLALLVNSHDHGARRVRVEGGRVEGGVRLVVEDEGPGFEGRLAERFIRLFQGLALSPEHVGAGLAVARRVAEQHGGFLELDAEVGRGVRAVVVLMDSKGPA